MPTPTNTTPGTATVIASLPYTLTVAAADLAGVPQGTGYPACEGDEYLALWWKYTTGPAEKLFFFQAKASTAAVYIPITTVWEGTPPGVTRYVTVSNDYCFLMGEGYYGIFGDVSTTYYIQVASSAMVGTADADLEITAVVTVDEPIIPVGSILIPDDESVDDATGIGYPAAVISAVDGTILNIKNEVTPGEGYASLATGEFCIKENPDVGNAHIVRVFDKNLLLIGSNDFSPRIAVCLSSDMASFFYVLTKAAAPGALIVYKLSSTASVVDSWTLPADSATALNIVVSRDNTTLYYSGDAINAYDLVNDLPLADLHAWPASSIPAPGSMVGLADDSVVWVFQSTISPFPYIFVRYDSSGTLLNTYTIAPTDPGTYTDIDVFDPISIGLETDPPSFWTRFNGYTDGLASFQQWDPATGALLHEIEDVPMNPGSGRPGLLNDTPYSISETCPFIIMQASGSGGGGTLAMECQPDSIGYLGVAFSSFFTASGGTPPYTYAITAGTLPLGLTLDGSTGEISGTPTTAGYYPFTAEVTDDVSDTADVDCSITISNSTAYPMCRKCRFPLPFDMNRLSALFRIEFLIQSGVSPDAEITINLSKDGGYTWPITRTMTAGALGAYDWRVYAVNFGQGRNWVCEFITSEPYFWALIQCYVDMEAGTS